MTILKDQITEVLYNTKAGLIGSGILITTKVIAAVTTEASIKSLMVYIGLFVGVLTAVKLCFEIYPAWIKIRDAWKKEQHRKQRNNERNR